MTLGTMMIRTSNYTSNMKGQKYPVTHKIGYKVEVVGTYDVQEMAFEQALRLQSSIFKGLKEMIYEKTMSLDPNQSYQWKLEQLQKAMIIFCMETNLNDIELKFFTVINKSKENLIDFKTITLGGVGNGKSKVEGTMSKYMYTSPPFGEYQGHIVPTTSQNNAP